MKHSRIPAEQLAEFKNFAQQLAERAAQLIDSHFLSAELLVERKDDASPVTDADRGAERVIRERIASHYPAHGIIGEEFGSDRPDAEFVWILDPIDGTNSFIHGVPLFGTLIALLHNGEPIVGVINQPTLKQMMIGDGETTTLNGRPVRARRTASLGEATLLYTDANMIERYQPGSGFDALRRQVRIARTWGDCYGYLLVAAGLADIMLDPIMNPWDLLPLVPIMRGAGAVITDWHGKSVVGSNSTVAAVPSLHAAVLRTLGTN